MNQPHMKCKFKAIHWMQFHTKKVCLFTIPRITNLAEESGNGNLFLALLNNTGSTSGYVITKT
jgi:hypothetical protein